MKIVNKITNNRVTTVQIEEANTMILSINLNPCLDKSVSVENFTLGKLNRVSPIRNDAAGKGINVALTVKELGGDAFVTGFNYSENGRLITNTLDSAGILHDLVMVLGPLRTNLKLFDTATGLHTEINEPGGFVSNDAIEDLRFRIRRRAEKCGVVAMSGSVPPGVPSDIYRTIITDLSDLDVKMVFDAERSLLREGIKAKPWMIKPNLNEMESLFERNYQDEKEIIADAKKIVEKGVMNVCVSMGALGAVLVSREGVWKAPAIEDIEPKGLQGGGDAMVAGICVAAEQGLTLPELLQYGTAAASASIILEGTQMCKKDDFLKLLPLACVDKIE